MYHLFTHNDKQQTISEAITIIDELSGKEKTPNGRMSDILTFLHRHGIRVLNLEFIQLRDNNGGEPFAAMLSLRLPKRNPHNDVIERVSKVDGVRHVEEI